MDKFPIYIKQLVSSDKDRHLVFLNDSGDQKSITVESYQATLISYGLMGYHHMSHLKNIYQIFDSFLKSSNYKCTHCELISCDNDIGYCKFFIQKNKKSIYINLNLGDSIILSLINNLVIYCSDEVWNEMNDFDFEMPFDDEQEF